MLTPPPQIFYYGTTYFTNAGFQNDPFVITVITNVVNVVSTLPGLWAVDKLGRRSLLLIGAAGMAVCQYIVAITGTVAAADNVAAQRAAIAFVCIYIFFFAASWGPVAWVVTGEVSSHPFTPITPFTPLFPFPQNSQPYLC